MQMYLQHVPYTSYPNGDPFSPTNVGDEADTVYHEYTHGLSNRLVVDAAGARRSATCRPARWARRGATGTPWTTWCAMGCRRTGRRRRHRDVPVRRRQVSASTAPSRSTAKSALRPRRCPGGATGHRGGYTYADYGQVIGVPEVHADGEIWAQTLWDLRDRLGSKRSESLVTRAM